MPLVDHIRRLFDDDETHVVELTWHFFRRLFDNEFVSTSAESHLGVAHVLVLLGLPSVFFVFYSYNEYEYIAQIRPGLYGAVAMRDQFGFVYLSMIVIGLVAILEWDTLFPDRLDYLTLTPLPLPASRIFGAKAAALVLFLLLFTVAVGAPGAILYPLAASSARHVGLFGLCWWMVAHGVSVVVAGAFIFLFFVAFEGLLLAVLNYRWFDRVSGYVQGAAIAALLTVSLMMPKMTESVPALERGGAPALRLLPPLWFFGLYRSMLGASGAVDHFLAKRALEGLGVVLAVSILGYSASYRRHLQRTIETADSRPPELWRAGRGIRWLARRLLLRNSLERASFDFVFKTLFGSRRHRLIYSAYTGVGVALILESLAVLYWRVRVAAPAQDRAAILLSVPLVLSFFALSGLRLVFEIPAELRANWIFQLTAGGAARPLIAGVRKAMAALGLLPLLTLAFPAAALHLTASEVAAAFLLDAIFSLILIEVLLLRFRKIPFTCSYLAAKSRSVMVWVFCWGMFTAYAYTLAAGEGRVLRHPAGIAVSAGLLFGALVWLRRRNREFLGQGLDLLFFEEREPAVVTLDLSHCALHPVGPAPGWAARSDP